MAVGDQTSQGAVNATLTQLARDWRDLADRTLQRQAEYVKLGASGLQGMGFTPADATTALDDINHMATLAGCYKGTVQQGGSGGTGAILFNFQDFLTHLWAGQ